MARCPSGHEALEGDKFCGECGQAVQASTQYSAPPVAPPTDAALRVTAPLQPSPAWPLPTASGTDHPTGSPPRRRATGWRAGAPAAAVIAGLLVLGAAAAGIILGATGGQGAGGQVDLSALARQRVSSATRSAVSTSKAASSTSTTSTTPVSPSTSQPTTTIAPAPAGNATGVAALPGLGALVGNWTGHGGGVQINPDGKGQATFRAYRFCSDNPTPPCDTMAGSTVVAGGRAQFVLRPTADASVATGDVLSSDDPEAFQPGFAMMVHLAPGDVLLVSSSPAAQNVAYCGSSATPGACGT